MIAVDTNILIRHIMGDHAVQSRLASDFLENQLTAAKPGFVTVLALYELTWALRAIYGRSAADAALTVREILASPNLVVECAELVTKAIELPVGFADALIHLVGAQIGCTKTVTFDKKFARLAGVELLR